MNMNKENSDNPYRPYDLESGEWFYHEDVIKQFKEFFESETENRVIVLQGNPGSGKSSTLKRIANNKDLLGDRYLPIYLDSKKYIELDAEKLMLAIYKGIIDKLIKSGCTIEKPAFWKKTESSDNPLEIYLLTFDAIISSDLILLLILDEFDKLLEKIPIKVIETVLQHFQKVEKNWANYGLILAGDNKLVNITKSKAVNDFLQATHTINIEESLDEDSIRKLIRNPVKEKLAYSDEALREIVWLCGNNLFFQQLICYYLVNLLNEKRENVFRKEHVEAAAERILNENKPQFVYAWEKILSLERQIIAAALADEDVTEQKGNYYFIKENAILNDIFGEKLHDELCKLQDFGYISSTEEKRFSHFPFKIPLYGKWIRKEHPFVKTIIENIEYLAHKIKFDSLIEGIRNTPDKKLMPFDKEVTFEIADKWNNFKKDTVQKQMSVRQNHVKSLLEKLFKLLNLNIINNPQSHEQYVIFDIKSLNIGILNEAICFVQDKPELTEDDIFNIERIAASVAEDTLTKLSIFFYFNKSEMVENIVKETCLNLIAINKDDLKKIIFSSNPRDNFRKIILSRLSLQKVSPYKTAGPAKVIFYGRIDIINQITRSYDTSYAIVGARKIGKTSLLHKIVDIPTPNTIYISMDLDLDFSSVKSYNPFLKRLQVEIEKVFELKGGFGSIFIGSGISRLPKIIQQLSNSNKDKKIVFIFDEIDGLIEFDKKNEFKLMRIFRTASQKNHCQFIFSGFKELYHQRRDIENPAYNFYEEIRLKPLDKEAALALITKPMESIGVHYENEDIRELILEYTACHPILLQFFCKKLVEMIDKKENAELRRTISGKDIEGLFNTAYEEYIMDEIYMFFSDLTNIDKLILILLAEEEDPGKKKYSTNGIANKLAKYGIDIPITEVYKNLRNLVMRFILLDEGRDRYSFALSFFPGILRKFIDEDFRDKLVKELKK